ncbi:TetR/AcrR family transcriptional regulator [Microbacterium lacus]|uniref:TetR/AcrR family transcriptional regulator n=1 Tax=Microbacterium lacus TaxID=415217 RepID=UPI00384BD9F1
MTNIERGRPRDPEVDKRIIDAAIDVFASHGWSGFTLDRVASVAKVGKGSVYLRWDSKTDLLTAALEQELPFVPPVIDSGSYAGDLRALGRQLLVTYSGTRGRAFLRVLMELTRNPEFGAYTKFRMEQLASGRAMVRRAKARGELPERVPVTLPLDALSGAILMHVLTAPRRASSAEALEIFLDNAVSLVLAATTDPSIDWSTEEVASAV